MASSVGVILYDQNYLGSVIFIRRASLCRPAGEGRLAVRSRSVRLGDLQRGQRAGLCGHLGPADQPLLLLEARYLRPLEICLPIALAIA